MTNCAFYERDEGAFREYLEDMRHCAVEGYTWQPDEEPETPCHNFCRHFAQHGGYTSEIRYSCERPENQRVLEAESYLAESPENKRE